MNDDDPEAYLVPRIHLRRLLVILAACLAFEIASAVLVDHWGRRMGWW